MKARAFMLLVGMGILPFETLKADSEDIAAILSKNVFADLGHPLFVVKHPTLKLFNFTVELRFEKNRFLLGEPVHFQFVVKNGSASPYWGASGGDALNALRRPSSFTVKVTDEKGASVLQPAIRVQLFEGGPTLVPIPAHGEMAYDLFLPHLPELGEERGNIIEKHPPCHRISKRRKQIYWSQSNKEITILKYDSFSMMKLKVNNFDIKS